MKIRKIYRKAREAVTGRVEVDKVELERERVMYQEVLSKAEEQERRIGALMEQVRMVEKERDGIREETYRNVAAGIRETERQRKELQARVAELVKKNIRLRERVRRLESDRGPAAVPEDYSDPLDLKKVPFALWLEEALRWLCGQKVQCIGLVAILEDGATETNYWEATVNDLYAMGASMIEDGILQVVRQNGRMLRDAIREDEEDEEDEEDPSTGLEAGPPPL